MKLYRVARRRRGEEGDGFDTIVSRGHLVYGLVHRLVDAGSDEAEEPEADPPDPWAGVPPEKLERALSMLPPREQDMIEMWLVLGKRQVEIAAIFGLTQAAVSYRIAKAHERLRFMLDVAMLFTPDEIRADLMGRVPDYRKGFLVRDGKALVETFAIFWDTGFSQLTAAKRMGVSQGCVRHRLVLLKDTILPALVEKDPERFARYAEGLTKAWGRWNIGRAQGHAREYQER